MSEVSSKIVLFVKNLKDSSTSIRKPEDVWIIEEVKEKMWKREHLIITDLVSFRKQLPNATKGAPKKTTYYGIVDDKYMIKHFIIEVAESVQDLEDHLKASRPHNPKRLSSSDAAVPLRYFTAYEEKIASSQFKKSKKAGPVQSKVSEGDDILRRAAKKGNSKTESKDRGKVSTTTSTGQNVAKGPKIMGRSPELLSVVDLTAEGTALLSNASDAALSAQAEGESLEALQRKLALLQQERDLYLEEANKLKADNEKLGKEAGCSSDLKKIQEEIRKIPEQIKKTNYRPDCPIREMKFAVEVEEDFQDVVVGDGEIYVGLGKTVRHEDVIAIEDDEDSLNKRGELVFNLICPDGLHNYSAAGRSDASGVKPIPDVVMKATKAILKIMHWDKDFVVNKAIMKKFWRKQPGEARRRVTRKAKAEQGITKPKKSNKRSKSSESSDTDNAIQDEPQSPKQRKMKGQAKAVVKDMVRASSQDRENEASNHVAKNSKGNCPQSKKEKDSGKKSQKRLSGEDGDNVKRAADGGTAEAEDMACSPKKPFTNHDVADRLSAYLNESHSFDGNDFNSD